jgi:trichohyalin
MKTMMLKIKNLVKRLDQATMMKVKKEAEAQEDARYQRRLELLMQQDEQVQKAKRDQDKESRRNQKDDALKVGDADGEALAEGRTVGEAEAGSKEQSSSKPSPKTQRKPRVKGPEEEMSPIIQKMVDEEVEKRLKAKQSLTRRLFQDECDEEDAKLQYEESMKKMKQASERMRKIKAEKDARMKKQFETRVKEELEKKRRDEAQKLQKKLWMEELKLFILKFMLDCLEFLVIKIIKFKLKNMIFYQLIY